MTDAIATPTDAPAETTATSAPAAPAATGQDTAPTSTPAEPTTAATDEVPDWAKDPAAALREVQRARSEAAAARTASRDAAKTEARAALLKELGLVKDDEPADPKALAADLTAARTAAQDAARELAIYRNAPAGTDVQALLDSRNFLAAVSQIDPADTTALVAAIGTVTSSNPRFKATQAAATSGVDLPGGNQALPVFTRAQLADTAFYQANKDAIRAAAADGRIH